MSFEGMGPVGTRGKSCKGRLPVVEAVEEHTFGSAFGPHRPPPAHDDPESPDGGIKVWANTRSEGVATSTTELKQSTNRKEGFLSPLRVLHCPTNVANNPATLARAERELGVDSWAVAFSQAYFDYRVDEVLWGEEDGALVRELKRWGLFWRALRRYDVIHFNFGTSIMPVRRRPDLVAKTWKGRLGGPLIKAYRDVLEQKDLAALKRVGSGLVVTYQGDDARQGDYCKKHFPITFASEVGEGYYSPQSDARKRKSIAKFDAYTDRIYALNPDLLHVLPRRAEFLPYSHVDLREWKPVGVDGNPGRPLLVHAPTHQGVKGTRYVLEAVSRLKAEGMNFDFRLIEGVSNTEARRWYEKADLLVDQVLAGWYGGICVEFMALGKPCVSYIREEDLRFIPRGMREELPIVRAAPSELFRVLKQLLTNPTRLSDLGQRGRAYVETWHDPLKTAARLKKEYRAIAPERWIKRPR